MKSIINTLLFLILIIFNLLVFFTSLGNTGKLQKEINTINKELETVKHDSNFALKQSLTTYDLFINGGFE